MGASLSFRADGTFTIVQFTDLHWTDGGKKDRRTRELMERVLEAERPDLIVFTGDVVDSLRCRDPYRSYREALAVAEESGVPWAATFGNHDCEGETDKLRMMGVQTAMRGSIAEPGPEGIAGVGNAVVRVAGEGSAEFAALFLLDSGGYSPFPNVPGYDWIRQDQIAWFREQSALLRNANGGRPPASLVFQHIPLPEYRDVWNTSDCEGRRFEKVQSPRLNSGFFAEMVRVGGVLLHGIRLCYGRATGYNTYGRWGFSRGARIIRLRQNEPGFESWLRLAGGKVIHVPRHHRPNGFSRA